MEISKYKGQKRLPTQYISYGLVSPHLENPADFPKPVSIWRGSCRDTPQLIYINVPPKPKKFQKKIPKLIVPILEW